MPDTVALTSRAEPAAVDRALDELDRLWERRPDVLFGDRARLSTAVAEVVGNVVEHADAGTLMLEVEVTSAALTARVSDFGRTPEVDLADVTMPPPYAETGRGLALAAAVADLLDHDRIDGGNRWTLVVERT
jgi:serine/threonine-protein kinase RsbW